MRAIPERKQLEKFLAKYPPEVASLGLRVLAKLRERLPGAVEFVYDKQRSLVVGFGPTEKPSDAIFSIEVFSRWINFYFLDGAVLPDPGGVLIGNGKRVRMIRLVDEKVLDQAAVRELISDAVELVGASFDPGRTGKILIRAVAGRSADSR